MSEIRDLCRKTYRAFIEKQPIPTELRRALRTHERVPTMIDNLARELSAPGLNAKRETVIQAVEDVTRLFVACVIRAAEEKALSPIARAKILSDQVRKQEINAAADALNERGTTSETQNKDGATSRQVAEIG